MKKRFVMALAFGMVIVFGAFCGGGKQAGDGSRPLRFILSNAYYTAPYCAAYNPSAIATAKALGVELTVLDGNGNQQTQLEHANLAIAQGYDGFLYFPADVDGALPVIEALNDSKIAWVGVNAYPGDDIGKVGMKYYVGPDAASHGHTMTGILKEKFPNGARLVTIEGTAGHMQTIQINRAFAEDLGSQYAYLDRQDCNFQAELAMTKITDMLTAYGIASKGGQIDCIISHDGGMLTGVISALEAQGIKPGEVSIIAMGSNKVLYNAMQSGWLSACSTQDPVAEAKLAVETLYSVIKGTASPGWTKLPTPVAYPETKDNFSWF
jgi:ABC-type sugar transport system substrate-binding protein